MELFWKGLSFGQRVVYTIFVSKKWLWFKGLFTSFLSARKGLWLKGVLKTWAVFFLVNVPQGNQSRMILKYQSLGTCVFGRWKGFGRLEAIASLDAYQISDLTKTHFLIAYFLKNSRKKILNQEFSCSLPRQHDQMVYSIFKTVPLGAPRPLIQMVP